MGNRAIYIIRENGENNYFSAHYGANALSPLLRMLQAQELQKTFFPPQPIHRVFEHLDYAGQYQNPRLGDADMFCQRIAPTEISEYNKSYAERSELEMRMVFDLDQNCFMMEYNPNCPWYHTMGSFSIDLDVGLDNVRKLLAHAEERGIEDFGRMLTIYQRSTGLEEKLESARGDMRLTEYLNSPQAQQDRERYRRLLDQEAFDEEAAEEMEER